MNASNASTQQSNAATTGGQANGSGDYAPKRVIHQELIDAECVLIHDQGRPSKYDKLNKEHGQWVQNRRSTMGSGAPMSQPPPVTNKAPSYPQKPPQQAQYSGLQPGYSHQSYNFPTYTGNMMHAAVGYQGPSQYQYSGQGQFPHNPYASLSGPAQGMHSYMSNGLSQPGQAQLLYDQQMSTQQMGMPSMSTQQMGLPSMSTQQMSSQQMGIQPMNNTMPNHFFAGPPIFPSDELVAQVENDLLDQNFGAVWNGDKWEWPKEINVHSVEVSNNVQGGAHTPFLDTPCS